MRPDRIGDYKAFAYIVEGGELCGQERKRAVDGQMVLLAGDGDEVRIENEAEAQTSLDVLLIAACR
jgi:hypothetical protein